MDELTQMIYREQKMMGLADPGAVEPDSRHLFNVGFRCEGDAHNDELTFIEAANHDGLLGLAEAAASADLIHRSLRPAELLYVYYAGLA